MEGASTIVKPPTEEKSFTNLKKHCHECDLKEELLVKKEKELSQCKLTLEKTGCLLPDLAAVIGQATLAFKEGGHEFAGDPAHGQGNIIPETLITKNQPEEILPFSCGLKVPDASPFQLERKGGVLGRELFSTPKFQKPNKKQNVRCEVKKSLTLHSYSEKRTPEQHTTDEAGSSLSLPGCSQLKKVVSIKQSNHQPLDKDQTRQLPSFKMWKEFQLLKKGFSNGEDPVVKLPFTNHITAKFSELDEIRQNCDNFGNWKKLVNQIMVLKFTKEQMAK
ncbi:uncharacterized protein [Clytia hemisphaerica]|uniref:uncharacterized protein n=1 Tax=Clytia hemisphaerica TaxID=252671 RepID=UPI0034D71149